LERPIHDNRPSPGQLFQLLPGCGHVLRWLLGEALQRLDCNIARGFPHLRKWGFVQPGKAGGCLERMLRGHNPQKQEVTRADGLQTEPDHEWTGDPSLYSLRSHVASPVSRWRCG
jgi:hypothetical protein